MTKSKIDRLYDYLFHYNPYERYWYCFKREDSHEYFNGNRKVAMRHKEIEELVIKIFEKDSK